MARQDNLLLRQYRRTWAKYYKFKNRLDRRIQNQTLYQLTTRQKNKLFRTLERLWKRLDSLRVQLKYSLVGAGLYLGIGFANPIQAQAPTPVGLEFQVNTFTALSQSSPRMTMDSDGDFVIAWGSLDQDGNGNGIYAQRYDASGIAQGTEFQVNTHTAWNQSYPSIAIDSDGDFVIAWGSYAQDGDANGIYSQRYSALGVAQAEEFRVNTYTTGRQRFASVAMDSDGHFVITWQSYGQDGDDYGIYAQRYDAAGVAQGAEFQVNTYTTETQRAPSIAMDSDGDFVIAWMSFNQDGEDGGGDWGVYAQRYNAAGAAQGAEFQVNTYTTEMQGAPSIAMDSDGDFVIAWDGASQDGGDWGIYAQRYNAAGAAQGAEFQVNTYTSRTQRSSAIARDSDGDFVISWSSYDQDGSRDGIYAQRYDASGIAQGTEFQVDTYTPNHQREPSIAMDTDRDFVIAWMSNGQDGSVWGIYAQRFQSANPDPPPTIQTNAGLTLYEGGRAMITQNELETTDPTDTISDSYL